MQCISCDSDLHPFTTSSYLDLPTFACSKCGLYVTGSSDIEIQEKTEFVYKEKHWGEKGIWNAEEVIKSNFTDPDSQGKFRSFTSQFKYCEKYIKNKKTVLEVGSGQGQATWWLEQRGFLVTGVEPDEQNVKLLNQKVETKSLYSRQCRNF